MYHGDHTGCIYKGGKPLPIQPEPSTVYVMKRVYHTLARDSTFGRRISMFIYSPNKKVLNKSFYEYRGYDPDDKVKLPAHGNAKKVSCGFVYSAAANCNM
jgi:hypothetical protein